MSSHQPPSRPNATALTLFGEEVSAEAGHGKTLRSLSKLMLDIAEARKRILQREALVQEFRDRLTREFFPVEDQFLTVRIETLRVLGAHLQAGWLKKRASKRLREALCELADELEDNYGADLEKERTTLLDQELLTEEEQKAEEELFSQFEAQMEEFFGVGSGGEKTDPEGATSFQDFDRPEPRRQRGRKPGGRSKAPANGEAEEQALAGDIRALYLLLARALHPDKETDEDRKREKTAWMQKVTVAYGARKLADLLDILAHNPMDAVGPYLSQAPMKTVQGFTKRLRRELTLLRKQAESVLAEVPPFFRDFLTPTGINESAMKGHLSEARRDLQLIMNRLEIYRTREGAQRLADSLSKNDWHGLM